MATDESKNSPAPIVGSGESALDGKGRLVVARKIKDRLGPNFVMTLSPAGSIVAYPAAIYNELAREFMAASRLILSLQHVRREFFGQAVEDLNFDDNCRMVLPASLRRAANIHVEDMMIVLAMGDCVEVWSKKNYDIYCANPAAHNAPAMRLYENAFREIRGLDPLPAASEVA